MGPLLQAILDDIIRLLSMQNKARGAMINIAEVAVLSCPINFDTY